GGYLEGGPSAYLSQLTKLQSVRNRRDQLFLQINQAQGAAKLPAAKEALAFLEGTGLISFYDAEVRNWTELAQKHDPTNAQGYRELFFEASWGIRFLQVSPKEKQAMINLVAILENEKKAYAFKDANRAARLHMIAAVVLARAGKGEQAVNYWNEARACKPSDPGLIEALGAGLAARMRSGTGFVVAPGGYILTNHHVIAGSGRLLVRLPNAKVPVPAKVIAQD